MKGGENGKEGGMTGPLPRKKLVTGLRQAALN